MLKTVLKVLLASTLILGGIAVGGTIFAAKGIDFSTSALADADVLLYVTDVVETPDKHNDFVTASNSFWMMSLKKKTNK